MEHWLLVLSLLLVLIGGRPGGRTWPGSSVECPSCLEFLEWLRNRLEEKEWLWGVSGSPGLWNLMGQMVVVRWV